MKQKPFDLKKKSINALLIRNTVVLLSAPERRWFGRGALALSSNHTLAAVFPEKGGSTSLTSANQSAEVHLSLLTPKRVKTFVSPYPISTIVLVYLRNAGFVH